MHTFFLNYRRPATLIVVLAVLVLSLFDADQLLPTPLRSEIIEALHIPAGLLLMAVAGLWIKHEPRPITGAVMVCVLVMAVLEGAAMQLGRPGSARELMLATAGAAYAGVLWYSTRLPPKALKRPLASTGLALVVVATLPIMQKLTAIDELKTQWPMLANFEADRQDTGWSPLDGALTEHAAHGELQTAMGMLDQHYLKVIARDSRSAGVRYAVLLPDWSSMGQVCLEARSEREGELRLAIEDQHHGVYSTMLPVGHYWKRHCFSLQALAASVDISRIFSLSLIQSVAGAGFDLDNLRLFR